MRPGWRWGWLVHDAGGVASSSLTRADDRSKLRVMRASRTFRRSFAAFALLLLGVAMPRHALAKSEPDLTARVFLDGSAADYEDDERLFGESASGLSHESKEDSQWGQDHDLRQIRVTWDRRFLYLAAEGRIWGDQLMVLIDVEPWQGLVTLNNTNLMRRHVNLDSGFTPDLIASTIDGAPSAQLLAHLNDSPSQLANLQHGAWFLSVSGFQQGADERASELMIPWATLFADDDRGPAVMRDTLMDGVFQRVAFIPPGSTLHIAGFVTGQALMSSGPDVAPNNALGCPAVPAEVLQIDNWVSVPLDLDLDGLPDMGVGARERATYRNDAVSAKKRSWGSLKAGWGK